MLDFGAHTGLGLLQLYRRVAQFVFLSALRTLGRMAVCQTIALSAFSCRLAAP